jgi:hypothetical protein
LLRELQQSGDICGATDAQGSNYCPLSAGTAPDMAEDILAVPSSGL